MNPVAVIGWIGIGPPPGCVPDDGPSHVLYWRNCWPDHRLYLYSFQVEGIYPILQQMLAAFVY